MEQKPVLSEEKKILILKFLKANGAQIIKGQYSFKQDNPDFYSFYNSFTNYAIAEWLINLLPLNSKALHLWVYALLQAEVVANQTQMLRTSSLAKAYLISQMNASFKTTNFDDAKTLETLLGDHELPKSLLVYYKEILIPALQELGSIAKAGTQRAVDLTYHLFFNVVGSVLSRRTQQLTIGIKLDALCKAMKTQELEFAEKLCKSIDEYDGSLNFVDDPNIDSKLEEFNNKLNAEIGTLSFLNRAVFKLSDLGSTLKSVVENNVGSLPKEEKEEVKALEPNKPLNRQTRRAHRTTSMLEIDSKEVAAMQSRVDVIEILQRKVCELINMATSSLTEIVREATLPALPGAPQVRTFASLFKNKLQELEDDKKEEFDFANLLSILNEFIDKTKIIVSELKENVKNSKDNLIEEAADLIVGLVIKVDFLASITSIFSTDSTKFKNEVKNKIKSALIKADGREVIDEIALQLRELKNKPDQLQDNAMALMNELNTNVFPELRSKEQFTSDMALKEIVESMLNFMVDKGLQKAAYIKLQQAQLSNYANNLLHAVFETVVDTLVNERTHCQQRLNTVLKIATPDTAVTATTVPPITTKNRVADLVLQFEKSVITSPRSKQQAEGVETKLNL